MILRRSTTHLNVGPPVQHEESLDKEGSNELTPGPKLPLYRALSTGCVARRTDSDVSNSLSAQLDEIKATKKENFDLKMKIFFLEERLGVGNGGKSMKELLDENVQLKVDFRSH